MDELAEFEQYLDNLADENFLIIKCNDNILGCGGHYVNHDKKYFGIAWVMFKRYELGLSNFLRLSQLFFETIIEKIKSHQLDYDIIVNTSQLLKKTLDKFGFETSEVIKNGFGEGLDHYVMRKRIN
ncbi:MAG: hypothetical protein OHK0057_12210 [Thermoflexibacter sp.]